MRIQDIHNGWVCKVWKAVVGKWGGQFAGGGRQSGFNHPTIQPVNEEVTST